MLPSTFRATIVAVSTFGYFGYAAGSCYWPNRHLANNVAPCGSRNSTARSVTSEIAGSPCCVVGDYCTSTGYCLSKTGSSYYRGACTDSTWRSDGCPQLCLTGNDSFTLGVASALLPCDYRQNLWCCTTDGPCCNETFANPPLGTLVIPSQVTKTVSQTATVAMTTVTAFPTDPYSPLCPTVDCVGVGLGVGVPLFVILMLVSMYAFWLYRFLYYPAGDQISSLAALAAQGNRREGKSKGKGKGKGKAKYDRADIAVPEDIPLQEVESDEREEIKE